MRIPSALLAGSLVISVAGTALAAPVQEDPPKQSVRVVTVTVTVVKIDRATRGLTYRTAEGVLNALTVDPEVTLFDEVQEGDVLVVDYIDAVVAKVVPGAKPTLFRETTEEAKASITDPGVRLEQQVRAVVTIDEVNPATRTVVYHAADNRRVLRTVVDPKLLIGLRPGDVVEVTFTRERAIRLARP